MEFEFALELNVGQRPLNKQICQKNCFKFVTILWLYFVSCHSASNLCTVGIVFSKLYLKT